jgi:8-oxo-dGTP pyrophosphatase MutT (NUDIX family)
MSPYYQHRRPLGHGRSNSTDAPAKTRDAATMIVWRNGPTGTEVLMGRRTRRAAFLPEFFVFPGGRIDPADHTIRAATPLDSAVINRMGVRRNAALALALAMTAVRETHEETGLLLAENGDIGAVEHDDWNYWKARGLAPALHRLCYFGRAITSPISPIRFHARFFIARAEGLQGQLGGSGELSELGFYPVAEVLTRMPIVDVTEFILTRVTDYAAAPDHFKSRTPVFSYKNEMPFIRYE